MGGSMKHLACTLWLLSALVPLCGCGGGRITPTPSPQGLSIAGNWQFSTTSESGMPPLGIAGSISQSGSGSSLSGAVHVSGSNCFDQPTTMSLTGTLTGSNISLTSTPVAGQVIAFTGSVTNNGYAFTGTYTINGGCANGDQGNVAGIEIPILDMWSGTFTASGGETFNVDLSNVAQDSNPSPEGSFPITGTATFSAPCFNSGALMSGTFPSGSFIIGTSVALEIQTGNGVVSFLGTANPTTGQISGNYTVSGGTCDQTGTAVLLPNPWDYY